MNSVVRENVKKIVQVATDFTVKNFCCVDPLESSDFNLIDLTKDWMSLVLVVGDKIKISHTVYFSLSDVETLIARASLGTQQPDATCTYYMKEFSNTLGGKIKQLLESNNVEASISLPLCTRTARDIFFFRGNDLFEYSWSVTTEFGSFINFVRCQLIDVGNLIQVDTTEDLSQDSVTLL